MDEQEEVVDVGDNLESLGFAYLFFRYLFPAIMGIVFVIGAAWFLLAFLNTIAGGH